MLDCVYGLVASQHVYMLLITGKTAHIQCDGLLFGQRCVHTT